MISMMRNAIILVILLAGCYQSDAPSCTISCATNDDCPGDLECTVQNLCAITAGQCTTSCTPGELVSCSDASTARLCNATGDGFESQTCPLGCDATAERCNCPANETSCTTDGNLQQCTADGSAVMPRETCQLGCEPAAGAVAAHCRYLEPRYLPTICDTPAVMPSLTLTSDPINTDGNTACNGGIITQETGAPQICVIRYGTIRFPGTVLTITGSRVPAFVADGALDITGATAGVNISANQDSNGPGAGGDNGAPPTATLGGGGAGYRVPGAPGGGNGTPGQGGVGGFVVDPIGISALFGGTHPTQSSDPNLPRSGGAGGALLLVSCKGTVTVDAAMIDAGGGGGGGGKDIDSSGSTFFTQGGGGGSGGYVVIQGAGVTLTGFARFYANGGGGGGSTNSNNDFGTPGEDGQPSPVPAPGGTGTGGHGGSGGTNMDPGNGLANGSTDSSYGGGGGAAGRFQIYTPAGVSPVNSAQSSPSPFEPDRMVPTR